MLFLIAAVIFGVFLLSRSPRLEGVSDVRAHVEEKNSTVRAYVDGKPVKSYLKED